MNTIKLTIAISIMLASLTACGNGTDGSKTASDKEVIGCTAEFRAFTVSIKDGAKKPVKLDNYSVTNLETGKDITIPYKEFSSNDKLGIYPIINDSTKISKKTTVEFKGYINNELVVKEPYQVSKGSCHVNLHSGNTSITLAKNPPNNGGDMVMCTTEFRYVYVKIKDAQNNAVVLDSYKVINKDSGEEITISEPQEEVGTYPLVNDASKVIKNTNVQFVGYKDNKMVVNEAYKITRDDCHIQLSDGKTEIKLTS